MAKFSVKIGGLEAPRPPITTRSSRTNSGGAIAGGDGIALHARRARRHDWCRERARRDRAPLHQRRATERPAHRLLLRVRLIHRRTARTTADRLSVGSGSQAIAVEYLVPNLKPSTTYHYRLVAYTTGAKVYGHDV